MNEHDEELLDRRMALSILRVRRRIDMGLSYGPGNKPWKMRMRKYEVVERDGAHHFLEAHYCFNNGDEGLVFRRYDKGEDKSTVVAVFAAGSWAHYKELTDG